MSRTSGSMVRAEALESRTLLSISVQLNYSLDTSGFFADTTRRTVLQAAVDAIDSRLADTLSGITPGGSNTWTVNFTHPATGAAQQISNPTIAADTIVLYVGARNLGTTTLGSGGPSGWNASGTQSFIDTIRARGESGALIQGSETDFAPAVGVVSFNSTSTWHFGTSTTGLSGKNDFFSVAMHEVGHVLGVGTAASWNRLSSTGVFTGAKSVASYGSNVPLTSARSHWAEGTRSNNQEAAMDPTITVGTRKNFTPLDFAGLDDIGWDITTPPTNSASIAGNLFNDADADGVKDTGETNLSGWTLFLDTDKDGVKDTGEPTATTDTSGNYRFSNLAAGSYRVREVVNSGFRRTTPSTGYHDVTLTGGQAVTGKNFGNTTKALISGNVFNDADGDGVKDSGEGNLSGWIVFLDTDKDGVFDTGEPSRTTDTSGNYSFKTLAAGTYRVRVVQQSGYRRTLPSSSAYYEMTLGSGGSSTGRNFGFTTNILISGTVFNDANGNRARDTGEVGLSGWRVYIDADNDGVFDSTERNTLTDSSGNWRFRALTAGTYIVRVQQQTGWTRTTPTTGTPPGSFTVTLTSGGTRNGLLFGQRQTA